MSRLTLEERQRVILDYWYEENPFMADALSELFADDDEERTGGAAWRSWQLTCLEAQIEARTHAGTPCQEEPDFHPIG